MLLFSYSKKPFSKFVNSQNEKFCTNDALDLINKTLVFDHSKRISAEEALLHPFFTEVIKEYKEINEDLKEV